MILPNTCKAASAAEGILHLNGLIHLVINRGTELLVECDRDDLVIADRGLHDVGVHGRGGISPPLLVHPRGFERAV